MVVFFSARKLQLITKAHVQRKMGGRLPIVLHQAARYSSVVIGQQAENIVTWLGTPSRKLANCMPPGALEAPVELV